MKIRWAHVSAFATVGSLFLLTGCSSNDSPHCTQRSAECLASQMICVSSKGAETCQACPTGQYAATADGCVAIPGNLIDHTFEAFSADPGQEITGECQSWTLNNDTELWVNTVEMENGGAWHHSNWGFVPDTSFVGLDGTWNCVDRGYNEVVVSATGGTLYAQSTQASQQVQKFPEGVAVRLPPHVRILGGVHILNTSSKPLTTALTMRLYTIDRADVTVPLTPFALDNLDLHIQPLATSNFTGVCDFASQAGSPGDLDADLYYVMPHYHALGRSFRLERYGGSNDGEVLYELGGYDAEPHSKTFDPPISMRGSAGYRFTCGYQNPYSAPIGYGVGDVAKDPTAGEMCVMLGFQRANYQFAGVVVPATSTVSETNGVFDYSATATVLAIPYTSKQGDL